MSCPTIRSPADTAAALKPPSAAHWFGTDQLGRDIFSRVIVATRLDTFIAVASVVLVFLMGGLAGIAAGYFGGWTDRIVGRIADTIMAFPLFVLAMGIVAALGNTVQNIIIATAIVNFPLYARVARAEANVRRDAGFVQAARLSGNGEFRILLVHILPNIMPIMIVQMSLTMGYAILNAAGLSFIGLGVRPPTAEWGIMVAEGAGFMVSGEWWIALFPGPRADGRGVLLQPARRRPARHRRSAAEDVRQDHDRAAAARRQRSHGGIRHPARHRQGGAACQHLRRQGRDARHRRRIRLRQVGDLLCGDADSRPRRQDRRRLGDVLRHRRQGRDRRPDARPARPRNLDDLPEPARGAQSDPQSRRPDRGRAAPACAAVARSTDRGEKAIEALEQVKIARPRERYHAYPFELSGGMCQRVVIALALACNPQLLIADEPTTGLDVTTQKAVMDLIVELTKRRGMSTILITHDLGLAAAYCDRVVVMEKGRVVETAKSADIFANPEHAYTKKLMRATPRLGVSLRDLLPEEEAAALPVHAAADAAPAGGDGTSRCCWSKSWSRNIRARAPPRRSANCSRASRRSSRSNSARSTASAFPSAMARASAWSANPAAANPPPR